MLRDHLDDLDLDGLLAFAQEHLDDARLLSVEVELGGACVVLDRFDGHFASLSDWPGETLTEKVREAIIFAIGDEQD